MLGFSSFRATLASVLEKGDPRSGLNIPPA